MRLTLATLLSPLGLFPALAAYMVAIVIGTGTVDTGRSAAAVGSGLLLAGFALGYGLLASVVVLLPGALILRRLGRARALTMATLGLAAGLAVGLWEGDPLALALFGIAGLGMGGAFGVIGGPALTRPPAASPPSGLA
jgi:hypothetical protein